MGKIKTKKERGIYTMNNNKTIEIFFDTEFTGLHKDTTLISIGLVTNYNESFYAEFNDYDKDSIKDNDWIQDNVIKNLFFDSDTEKQELKTMDNEKDWIIKGNKQEVKEALAMWLNTISCDGTMQIQLYSDVCHYDFLLFIDLFGTAFDLPSNVSPYCHDINGDIANVLSITHKHAFNCNREKLLEYLQSRSLDYGLTNMFDQKHNALNDAIIIMLLHKYMKNYYAKF